MTKQNALCRTADDLFNHLGDEHDFIVDIPVDVELIAKKLGIGIEYGSDGESQDFIGGISFRDNKPIITINPQKNSYTPRKRFTIAHEIGHYCLHSVHSKQAFKDSRKAMSRTESYWDFIESEANSFAAQLLMPGERVIDIGREVIDKYKDKHAGSKMPIDDLIREMAARFEVSSKAMEYRLRNAGIFRN